MCVSSRTLDGKKEVDGIVTCEAAVRATGRINTYFLVVDSREDKGKEVTRKLASVDCACGASDKPTIID